MGRPRRYIDETGHLLCKVCERWQHISQYRTLEVIEGLTRLEDIWYEEDGKEYGRPDGYCRPCASKRAQGPQALAKYLEELRTKAQEVVIPDEVKAAMAAILREYAGMPGSTMQVSKDEEDPVGP
jgi:hypothetical protein